MDGLAPKSIRAREERRSALDIVRSCGLASLAPDAARRICKRYEIGDEDAPRIEALVRPSLLAELVD